MASASAHARDAPTGAYLAELRANNEHDAKPLPPLTDTKEADAAAAGSAKEAEHTCVSVQSDTPSDAEARGVQPIICCGRTLCACGAAHVAPMWAAVHAEPEPQRHQAPPHGAASAYFAS
jgi:hypothetical protein